ncbi:MAG TPA: DUF2092 domain-containing protein [Rudaea sp.]|nr:DUF2092 domain-containing protein [Rudaea sp.]
MSKSVHRLVVAHLLWACLLLVAAPMAAAEETAPPAGTVAPAQLISPEAQAVLDRMTAFLKAQKAFSIDSQATRDDVVAFGYKLQENEHATLTAQLTNKLRVDVSGDDRNRQFYYDGATLTMYSPDDEAYTQVKAPDTIGKLVDRLLGAGIEMPMIDMLYQIYQGRLTEAVRGGVLVGDSNIDGADCDHLAFRQGNVDWQLWVEQGDKPLPRKLLVTTRYEVGDPQYQVTMRWNLKPKIDASTFAFKPPKGVNKIPFSDPAALADAAP